MVGPDETKRFVDGYLPYLLAQAAQKMSYRFHVELKKDGIRETEWRVLSTLYGAAPMTLGTLETHVLAPQSTLSRTVDRLVKRELLTRTPDADDRRVMRVALSEDGRTLAERLIAAARAFQAQDLQHLPDDEAERLSKTLASLFRGGA
jgi:DNA-binding MarR family transcriptional regulator